MMPATSANFSDPFNHPVPSTPFNPGVMHWPVYRDMYVKSVRLRSDAESDHPSNVAKVLDRFTAYTDASAKTLDVITSLDFEAYLQTRKKDLYRGRSVSNVTLNNEIRILNAAFGKAGPRGRGRAAENWNLIASPPFGNELPEFQRDAVVIEDHQLAAFLEASRSAKSPHPSICDPELFWKAAILLELVTRLRRKSLIRVPRPSDRQLLHARQLPVPAEITKTRRSLVCPLGGEIHGADIVNVLASLPTKPGQPLLPWQKRNGTPMTLGHFTNTFAAIQRAAGIDESERIRIKDLRSTAGTLIADEFGDAVAKKALGHGPNTNTLNTNYKSYRPRAKDFEASDFMAAMAMKALDGPGPAPEPPAIVRFPGGRSA